MTYGTLISSVTVGAGGASSIDFTDIPQSPYTDLILVISGRTNRAATNSDIYMQVNGVTSATYSFRRLYGSGSSVGSDSLTNNASGGFIGFLNGNNATTSIFGSLMATIPNYAGSTAKSWSGDSISENNGTEAWQQITAGYWSGTSAITSISVKDYNSASFQQYTTAYLYGLTKGSGGASVS